MSRNLFMPIYSKNLHSNIKRSALKSTSFGGTSSILCEIIRTYSLQSVCHCICRFHCMCIMPTNRLFRDYLPIGYKLMEFIRAMTNIYYYLFQTRLVLHDTVTASWNDFRQSSSCNNTGWCLATRSFMIGNILYFDVRLIP